MWKRVERHGEEYIEGTAVWTRPSIMKPTTEEDYNMEAKVKSKDKINGRQSSESKRN